MLGHSSVFLLSFSPASTSIPACKNLAKRVGNTFCLSCQVSRADSGLVTRKLRKVAATSFLPATTGESRLVALGAALNVLWALLHWFQILCIVIPQSAFISEFSAAHKTVPNRPK